MHLIAKRQDILEPLQQVRQAVDNRSPLQVMTGIKFVASKDGLKLIGSDTAITIVRLIPADKVDVKRLGSAVLPADKVVDIIKSLPGEEVEIKMTELIAQISSERSLVKLVGMDQNEYHYKKTNHTPDFKIPGSLLRSMIKRTAYAAAAKDKTSEIIMGMLLKVSDGRLSILATNRNRAAAVFTNIESESTQSCVMTVGHMQIAADVFAESDTEVSFSGNEVIFSKDSVSIHSRIMEGTFPLTEHHFEIKPVTSIGVSANDIIDAIRLVSITSDIDDIFFEVSESEIKLFGKGETGRTEDVVTINSFDGEPFRFVARGKYITEAIKSVNSDTVTIKYAGENKPFIFTGDNQDGKFLVLPMRVRGGEWE